MVNRLQYIEKGVVAERSLTDALHVATATISERELIVGRNFKDVVHFEKITSQPIAGCSKLIGMDDGTGRGDHPDCRCPDMRDGGCSGAAHQHIMSSTAQIGDKDGRGEPGTLPSFHRRGVTAGAVTLRLYNWRTSSPHPKGGSIEQWRFQI